MRASGRQIAVKRKAAEPSGCSGRSVAPEDKRLAGEVSLARQDFLAMAAVLETHMKGRQFVVEHEAVLERMQQRLDHTPDAMPILRANQTSPHGLALAVG